MKYLPPKNTHYIWGHGKQLSTYPYRPCFREGLCWPQSARLYCWQEEHGKYHCTVLFSSIDINKKSKSYETFSYESEVDAIREAEGKCQELFEEDTKPWMKEAVECG